MKRLEKLAVCLAGGLMLNISLRAADPIAASNPYGPIVVRNVFGLNPPTPAVPVAPEDPPLKITPNGIMSILGQLQVLFKVAPKPGQPGAKEMSYVLSEGQAQDDIEVTHIDEANAIITFNNHGTVQEIPLSSAPALNMPAPAAGQNFPAPGGIPTRFGGARPGVAPGGPGGRFGVQSGGAGSGPAMNPTPTRGSSLNPQTQNPIRSMSAEDQEMIVVANKLKAQNEGDPILPLFPPTSLDGPAGVPSNTGPGTP